MRILVTGATGFAGSHLAEALLSKPGVRVVGLSRRGEWPADQRHLAGRVELLGVDLCDGGAVEAALRAVEPEQIFHVAGYAHVGRSFQEPDAAWSGNLAATRSLYEAVARWGGKPRVLFVGSGLVYGDSDDPETPRREDLLLRPNSPYATSKSAADLLSYQFTRDPGLHVVIARPFNHIGPRQAPDFAVANFARQVVAIERGEKPPLMETGNLSPRRDLTDVRDTVMAYDLLMQHGRSGEAYNVGTGQVYSMHTVLDRLLALAGLTVELRQKASLLRSTDTPVVRVDASKLRRETGWSPRYTLDQTLLDTLNFWREQSADDKVTR
jgi:GDP-4-dehydro-6-deoxy-D-mannose reductase